MIYNGMQLCDYCFREKGDGKFCTHCGLSAETYRHDARLLPPGTVLNGHYTIGKVLGQGGFGATYLALSSIRGCVVAIKEYLPMNISYRDAGIETVRVTSDDKIEVFKKGAQRFFEEAETISRFAKNINIVSVYEFFYANNTVYYAMEYLNGVDLREHIRRSGGSLPFAEIVDVALGVCNALKALHDGGILHRDIAPDNIFRCNSGALKLIDFGTAKQVVSEGEQNFSVVVKDGFAPIEQYKRNGRQGPWTDIYALGATLYYAYTGQVVPGSFDRLDTPELSFCGKEKESPTLVAVISKCLAVRSEDRYQNVSDIMRDVCRAKAEFTAAAAPSPAPAPAAPVPQSAAPVSAVPPSANRVPVSAVQPAAPVSAIPQSAAQPAPVPQSATPVSAIPKSASQPAPAVKPAASERKETAPKKNTGLIIGLIAGGAGLILIVAFCIISAIGNTTSKLDYYFEDDDYYDYNYNSYENNSTYDSESSNAYDYSVPDALSVFRDSYGKYGYKDGDDNIVIPPIYDDAYLFTSDGLAVVSYGGLYGYIDEDGDFVIEPQFEYAFSFCESRAMVRRNGKWGYIDEYGDIVIDAVYDDAYNFIDGEAQVVLNDLEFYIDKYGNYLRPY